MIEYILAFVVGGIVTFLITYLEANSHPILSGLAALFPVFTWVSYLFIGNLQGAEAVSKHSMFVLLGTIFAWIPYMLVIYYFSPRIGVGKAILLGVGVFIVLALIYLGVYIRLYGGSF